MAAFWGGLLGMKPTGREEDWLDLEPLAGNGPASGGGTTPHAPRNGPVLAFQRVLEGKTAKNRLHLDLDVPDIHAAGERARRLGATPAGEPMGDPRTPFQVWYDPEGNEFCFCTAR
ncbi:VOC family protein [Actinomadura syzygii]|uniref:VOC family protein n=2 Tax=Actinomadura syzygii TaxID=1427538 RepID=A0A5D0U1T8_9ACTN|nr:VOC family protein [Actinomadura syzygii]